MNDFPIQVPGPYGQLVRLLAESLIQADLPRMDFTYIQLRNLLQKQIYEAQAEVNSLFEGMDKKD